MPALIPADPSTAASRFERFASEHAGDLDHLDESDRFPIDLWSRMGRSGLLGHGIPEKYGGRGGGYLDFVAGGESFVRSGAPLGLALSVGLHLIVARFLILGAGNEEQQQQFLPKMAAGEITGCLAVSEPKTGAHPKYLKTTAIRDGNDFILNGEKTYLTNGPIAGLFVVMAVTDEREGKKEITAFPVPRETPGLTVTEPMDLGFLRPSPHGGIVLKDARVPAADVLGEPGRAYEALIKPFREVEDAVLTGPMAGGMARQLNLAARLFRDGKPEFADDLKDAFGRLQYLAHIARIVSFEVGRMLDTGEPHEEFLSLLLAARRINAEFQGEFGALLDANDIIAPSVLKVLSDDLAKTNRIAANVMGLKQRKLGAALLAGSP